MTNEKNCILAERCKLAGGASCNRQCSFFIALHGMSGKGGRVAAAGLPADYRLLTLKNSPARAGQPQIYQALEGYVDTFERQFEEESEGNRIKSMYLYSESPGTGKTTTAAALLNEFIMRHYYGCLARNRQADQQPAYFLDVNSHQELYTGFTRPGIPADVAERNSRPYYRQMEAAKTAPFAVLDDIGVRQASEGFRGDLHTIINYRCANGLPTIYTSNLPIDDMASVFDRRLYDRMRDMCAVLHFEGESKRGKR